VKRTARQVAVNTAPTNGGGRVRTHLKAEPERPPATRLHVAGGRSGYGKLTDAAWPSDIAQRSREEIAPDV